MAWTGEERRRETRMPAYLGARLSFNQRYSTMDCLVRNVSDEGARIALTGQEALPDRFEFEILKRQETRQARVVWRRHGELGVAFVNPPSPKVVPLEMARQLKTLRDENQALRQRLAELQS